MRLRHSAVLRIDSRIGVHHGRRWLPVVLRRHSHARLRLMHHLGMALHHVVLLVHVGLLRIDRLVLLRLAHHSWVHGLRRSLLLRHVRGRRVGLQLLGLGRRLQLFFQTLDDGKSAVVEFT